MTAKEALEKSEPMNIKDLFKVRPMDETNKKFVISIGNRLASTTTYNSREEAEKAIENKDWNLIATLICEISPRINSKSEEQ